MNSIEILTTLLTIDVGRGRKLKIVIPMVKVAAGWPEVKFRLEYLEEDVDTGKTEMQYGRWWYIEPDMTKDAIIKTVWLAASVSDEHVRREWFKVDGERIFDPHAKIC